MIYRSILKRRQPDRELFLAVPNNIAKQFEEPLGLLLREDYNLRVMVFRPKKKEIIRWLP
jgi:hypothetical protein